MQNTYLSLYTPSALFYSPLEKISYLSKLPKEHSFIDLSDYGRPIAQYIAKALKRTSITPVQVTLGFIVSGGVAIYFILKEQFWLAGFFLVLKSILDAADGELARLKNTPSYTGRYLDSIADILLNAAFLLAIWHITHIHIGLVFLAFIGIQLQGTLYNYYYVILRNTFEGDTTSRIIEDTTPIALPGEKQQYVTILFWLYRRLYGTFDRIIYVLDRNAPQGKRLPKWLMTAVSTFGLGFQLLLICVFLILGWKAYIIPFFIGYSVMILGFIGIRKWLNR